MPPIATDTRVQVEIVDSSAADVTVVDDQNIAITVRNDEVAITTACERGAPGTARIRNEPHDIELDGVQQVTLSSAPAFDWELIHLNGVLLRRGADYSISGAVVTLVDDWELIAGDRIDAVYPF